ncbi:MAG TPA: hypothetical protein HPP83_13185 [Candidatus Hydrogenedentes bacterium]|nr:hypothetical protein [Candidatus Hydrogenedentota bacterium]
MTRPDGWIVLIWNRRQIESSAFQQAYERILRTYAKDYGSANHRNVGEDVINDFFKPGTCRLAAFDNWQEFDFEGLRGRLLSSSYTPTEGRPEHAPMMADLRKTFGKHQTQGKVRFDYKAVIYYGQLR